MSGPMGKVVGFVLVVMVLAALTSMFLQPSLGEPREQDRLVHPGGFSIVAPRDWLPGRIELANERGESVLRFVPNSPTAHLTSLTVTQLGAPPVEVEEGIRDTSFQGAAARVWSGFVKRNEVFLLTFERDGRWYEIRLDLPRGTKVESGPWMKFLESFRIESSSPAQTQPASAPTPLPG